ncbi:MAG TPA: DUF2892 domain-containing protein [Vicinamibacterales bacterium]|nr:DUF2892 domain-containing protein [Vicinamibacterales bacterium]
MTINEGTWDRAIRIAIGLMLGFVAWSAWPAEASFLSGAGVASVVLLVIGIVAFVTGVVGWCALYQVLGLSTNKRASV